MALNEAASGHPPRRSDSPHGRACGDQRTLHLSVRLALRDAPPDQRLVLLVDQLEETFTLCHDESQCRALIDNLLYAASVALGQTVIILTLRADFYGRCAAHPALASALSEHQMLVGPMDDDELRRAVERPAQVAGCEFEPGLTRRLLRRCEGSAGWTSAAATRSAGAVEPPAQAIS